MNLTELSKLLGQPESDVVSFLAGVSVFVSKGLSVEEAIKKHMEVMKNLANNACKVSRMLSKDESFVGSVYDAMQ